MLTIEALQAQGVNTEEGLARCLNNESFYLNLVGKALEDDNFEQLAPAVNSGDLKKGFEIAHSLKGVLGNLALTPLYEAVADITELLRAETQTDYAPYLEKIEQVHAAFVQLSDK